jgi:hypothetical protein
VSHLLFHWITVGCNSAIDFLFILFGVKGKVGD